jgi:hypothetical protein
MLFPSFAGYPHNKEHICHRVAIGYDPDPPSIKQSYFWRSDPAKDKDIFVKSLNFPHFFAGSDLFSEHLMTNRQATPYLGFI